MSKSNKSSISIRIPQNYYEKLKERAGSNKRPLIAELTIILDDYLTSGVESSAIKRLKAIQRTAGIIKNLPKGDYARNVDDELYRETKK